MSLELNFELFRHIYVEIIIYRKHVAIDFLSKISLTRYNILLILKPVSPYLY